MDEPENGIPVACYQCPGKPAMYVVGPQKVPLCLDCYFKVAQIQQQQQENNERIMNHCIQEMEFITGLPGVGPRFPPRPPPVYVQGAKLNNISVNNSVVGVINTGSLGTVDQSITVLKQLGEPALADAIRDLSEAILRSADLTRRQQNELISILGDIGKQAATPIAARDKAAAAPLISRAIDLTAKAIDIADVGAKLWPVVSAFFSAG